MALFTLLEKYDFSGKTLVPFCTHDGSHMGRSVDDIKKLCPGARMLKGFAAFGDSVEQAGKGVDAWLSGIGMAHAK